MIAYEGICLRERPDAIVVVGDVNATAACAMVGTKLWIPVVHLEAGLLALQTLRLSEAEVHLRASTTLFEWSRGAVGTSPGV